MKIKFAALVGVALLLSLPLLAQDGNKALIVGSAHDLTDITDPGGAGVAIGMDGSFTQVCAFCHIPHGFDTQDPGGGSFTTANRNGELLWNHQLSAGVTYTPYTSDTLKAPANALDGTTPEQFYSLACLSCHDGQTAVNAVYRVPMQISDAGDGSDAASTGGLAGFVTGIGTGPVLMGAIDSTRVIGTDLSNDHPVNINYATALTAGDTGLWDITAAGQSATIGVANATPGVALTAVRTYTISNGQQVPEPILFNDTVQCASCHNPHSTQYDAFLRDTLDGSQLCLDCHGTT